MLRDPLALEDLPEEEVRAGDEALCTRLAHFGGGGIRIVGSDLDRVSIGGGTSSSEVAFRFPFERRSNWGGGGCSSSATFGVGFHFLVDWRLAIVEVVSSRVATSAAVASSTPPTDTGSEGLWKQVGTCQEH